MTALLERAEKPPVMKSSWIVEGKADLTTNVEQTISLGAPIVDVQAFLQRKLKPHRKFVSIVKFASGEMEQVTKATLETIDVKKPSKAVTVAQPVVGCPAPDFDEVDVRATRVLLAFLSPEQAADFREQQQFVAIGADTGHRYLLTSRSAPRVRRHPSYRSVFDMDENQAFCIHDWEVPAAEELLALKLHLEMPGLETYARSVPDRDGILHA